MMLARSLSSCVRLTPSTVPTSRALSSFASFDASKLVIKPTATPKEKLPFESLTFGGTYTDHILEVDWDATTGWSDPVISAYHALAIDPAASSLHYALQCFEGMKAYLDAEGRARLFRPDMNYARFNRSLRRLALPEVDVDQFAECLKQFILVEKDWIPNKDGYSLYIRPTAISTYPFLGVGQAMSAKIYAITSPVGPYYPQGFAPVQLLADTKNVRAWPGGTGDFKVGSNYGPAIQPQIQAGQQKYSQVLWLFGEEGYVTEVGTMNMFVLWINEDGEKELITAPLDGTILPGVTRQSVIELCQEWGEFKVSERLYTMDDIAKACTEGRMIESFGSGTAAVVSPINLIGYNGKDYEIPLNPEDSSAGAGPLTQRVFDAITDIQYGRTDSEWSVVLD